MMHGPISIRGERSLIQNNVDRSHVLNEMKANTVRIKYINNNKFDISVFLLTT